MSVNSSIREARISKGLTIKEVSEATGIPFRTLQNYELGLRELSLENAYKLSKFYKLSIERLCFAKKQ